MTTGNSWVSQSKESGMDQRELRVAMDHAVAVTLPPMREEPVLAAGRQALKRRRATRASIGSAAVVAVVAVGMAVLAPSPGHDSGTLVGDQPSAVQNPPPKGRTATSGVHYDRGVALAAALDAVAPAGYAKPDDLRGVGDYAGRTLKNHEAFSLGVVDGSEVWSYSAGTPLTKDGGVGEMIATVFTPGRRTTGDGCGLTPVPWDAAQAQCTEVNVGGKKVAVADATYPPVDGLAPAQWAGYRDADGTLVFVMQTARVARAGHPGLSAMPMTGQQLAAVAADPRLRPW